ncbi:MAG TPA: hypothetical protein VLW52_03755 [Opitutaceae bacterium]|nr:hypothetical protein [Opitutaceae bacterium]
MNSRLPALLPIALITLLAGCASAPAPSTATRAGSGSPAADAVAASGPEATLQKGMPVAMVKRIMGEPSEIRPMKSPEGKAEIWVYHRTTRGAMQQIPIGTTSTDITTIGLDGKANVQKVTGETIVRQETQIVDETINLLIFDDQFIEQNKFVQTRMEYQ